LAIDVLVARAGDPTTETLILGDDATCEPVWTVGEGDARHASIGAGAVLARETRHAIVGIVAAWSRSKASADLEVARVLGVTAVVIVRAGASSYHEAALQIIASGLVANLAHGAGIVIVAEVVFVGACRTKRADATTRPRVEAGVETPVAGVGNAPIRAALIPVQPAVQIDARIAANILERGGSGITTASRRRNGQQHVSKGSHDQGGGRVAASWSVALLPGDRIPSA